MAKQTFESEFGFTPAANANSGVRKLEHRIVNGRIAVVSQALDKAEQELKTLLDDATQNYCDPAKLVAVHQQAVPMDSKVQDLATHHKVLIDLATEGGYDVGQPVTR